MDNAKKPNVRSVNANSMAPPQNEPGLLSLLFADHWPTATIEFILEPHKAVWILHQPYTHTTQVWLKVEGLENETPRPAKLTWEMQGLDTDNPSTTFRLVDWDTNQQIGEPWTIDLNPFKAMTT